MTRRRTLQERSASLQSTIITIITIVIVLFQTKTNFSDVSMVQRKPSLAHNRFVLFDNHQPLGVDPTHPSFDHPPSLFVDANSRDVSFDANTAVFDDMQVR